jgi:hypothetical protein
LLLLNKSFKLLKLKLKRLNFQVIFKSFSFNYYDLLYLRAVWKSRKVEMKFGVNFISKVFIFISTKEQEKSRKIFD